MNGRMITTLLLLVAASAALTTGANAQVTAALAGNETRPASVATIGSGAEPNQFGTNWAIKVIPVTEFVGSDYLATWSISGAWLIPQGERTFLAAIDLPAGAEVSQVCLFAIDNNAGATPTISMTWSVQGTTTAEDTHQLVGTAATTGAPGRTLICVTPAAPVPVRAFADVDGDGDSEYSFHQVSVYCAGDPPDVQVGSLTVQWRRAISPAPVTATFPNDVPTAHPLFQYVEALGASGVTAGCSPGSFCPDNQLTRGEMAVFLTKALGLYWPQ